MEAVFSVSTSRAVAESGVSNSLRGDVATSQVASGHLVTSKYPHPVSLGTILHSEHASVGLGHIGVSQAAPVSEVNTDHHLIHFSDDLSLTIKTQGSPLDDDDDVRSLLDAAAAAAASASASPRSPQLQSSSGLNTPPDTRIGRPLDNLACHSLKVSLCESSSNFYAVDNSSLLASHLGLSNSGYVSSDDPLSILLPTSSTETESTHYLTPNTPVPSTPLAFNPQSPSMPPCSSNGLSVTYMHTRQTPVMMIHNNLSCDSETLSKDCVQHSFNQHAQFCTSVATPISQTQTYVPCQNDMNSDFDSDLSILNQTSDIAESSDSYICNTSERPSTLLTPSTCFKDLSSEPIPSPLTTRENDNFTPSTNSDPAKPVVESWPNPLTNSVSDLAVHSFCVPGSHLPVDIKLAEDELDNVSNATAENLMDLEQVISSHSASLPAEDDDLFTLKTSVKDFGLTSAIDSNDINTVITTSPHQSDGLMTSIPEHPQSNAEPDFPDVYGDNLLTKSDCTGSTEAQLGESFAELKPPSSELSKVMPPFSPSEALCAPTVAIKTDSKERSDSPDIQNSSIQTPQPLESVGPTTSDVGSLESTIRHEAPVTPLTVTSLDREQTAKSGGSISGESNRSVKSEDDEKPPPTTTSEPQVYDDAEYAAAAVAAVDDVVFALAGNRKPDPSLALDPALEGTGTDRIYTLSLAPVHNDTSGSSHVNSCSFSSNHSSNFSIVNSCSGNNFNDSNIGSKLSLSAAHNRTQIPVSRIPISATNYTVLNSVVDSTTNTPTGLEQHGLKHMPNTNVSAWEESESKGDFLCLTCHKTFPQRALLFKHRVMHDEPKHVCDTCGRSFVREDKLKRHVMSIHTTEKPHICHICSKAFSRKDKLKDHIKHHDRAARSFECQQCQQPFVQKSDLNRHIRGVHQGEPGVGINMATKRKAPGTTPSRPVKKKSRIEGESMDDGTRNSSLTSGQTPNGKNGLLRRKVANSDNDRKGTQLQLPSTISTPASTVSATPSSMGAVVPDSANLASCTITPSSAMVPNTHPVFAAGASGLMLPTMALTQAAAHHHFVQQQQQQQAAAAAAAVMLPSGSVTSMTPGQASAMALQQQQQQQQQFFTMAAMPTLAQTNNQAAQQSHATHNAHQQSAQVQFQPELKAVATPSGPMMVLTRIAAANQANQNSALASQTVFPQVVGFHTAAAQQQQQLQQLHQQQQAAVAHQHQLLQQHQANYAAAAAAAAAAGTQLVAVSNQHVGAGQSPTSNQSMVNQAQQFQLHQQASHQLQQQQQQVAALAAHQQAAHSFLFPSGASGASMAAAASGTPAFFCHPQEGVTAGLILASSTDATSFALAAAAQAQAAAAAAAAQQRQQNQTPGVNTNPNALSASALAAATGLQVVAGYTAVDAQHAATQQQLHQHQQQQIFLQQQQQQQQRLAAVAAAAAAAASTSSANHTTPVLVSGTASDGSTASVLLNSSGDEQLGQVQQPTQLVMAQPEQNASTVNNCYQLAAFTNAAAALYQQHPGFMFAAANTGASSSTGSATVAAMALHQQQQQYQQQQQHMQQAGLMAAAAYHHHQQQQQQAAHHQHTLQQQHVQAVQQQQQQQQKST